MTIHGAKGNEFDHVYLAGLAEDVLPSFQSREKGDRSPEFEEERRNCYVAVTRCQQTLTLSYAERYSRWIEGPVPLSQGNGTAAGRFFVTHRIVVASNTGLPDGA